MKPAHITSSSNLGELIHDYVASGYGTDEDLTLRITGSLKNWEDSNIKYGDRVVKLVNLGSVGWEDLNYAFRSNSL